MKPRLFTPYSLSLVAGMGLGLLSGDYIFPELEAACGDPFGDIVFAAGGAAIASLIHDVVKYRRDAR
jgi:hypothetical protein